MFNFKEGQAVSSVIFGKTFYFKRTGHPVACFTFANTFLTSRNIKFIFKNRRY